LRNAYREFVGKSEGKTLLGRPRHKWEDSVGMDPVGMGQTVLRAYFSHVAQDRVL
jgi:hypothetical protein